MAFEGLYSLLLCPQKPGACHESVAIRVRVLELCGLGGNACLPARREFDGLRIQRKGWPLLSNPMVREPVQVG